MADEGLLECRVEGGSGLFRAAQAARVLAGRGAVFRDRAEFDATAYGAVAQGLDDRADALYRQSEPCDDVDAFVSHAWCDGAFAKYLALCLRNSLGLAVAVSLLACLALVVILLGARGWDFAAYRHGTWLKYLFAGVCGGSFLLTFACGHALGFGHERWWLDKLCIHQSRHDLKSAAIGTLPYFLARSDRLIVLHSENYFQRLWCAFEVSTFLAERPSSAMDVVPLWFAPWLLATMCLDLMCSPFMNALLDTVGPPLEDAWGLMPSLPVAIVVACCVAYSPAAVVVPLGFRARARALAATFDALEAFSFAKARCGSAGDRARIEAHVVAAHGSVEAFERLVRTELRDRLQDRCGSDRNTPFALAALPFLPFCWTAASEVFIKDSEAALLTNFPSVRVYALANLLAWAQGIVVAWSVFPCIFCALATTERARRPWVRHVGGALVVLLCYVCWGLVSALGAAVVFFALSVDGGAGPCLVMALWFAGLARWTVYLFRGRK